MSKNKHGRYRANCYLRCEKKPFALSFSTISSPRLRVAFDFYSFRDLDFEKSKIVALAQYRSGVLERVNSKQISIDFEAQIKLFPILGQRHRLFLSFDRIPKDVVRIVLFCCIKSDNVLLDLNTLRLNYARVTAEEQNRSPQGKPDFLFVSLRRQAKIVCNLGKTDRELGRYLRAAFSSPIATDHVVARVRQFDEYWERVFRPAIHGVARDDKYGLHFVVPPLRNLERDARYVKGFRLYGPTEWMEFVFEPSEGRAYMDLRNFALIQSPAPIDEESGCEFRGALASRVSETVSYWDEETPADINEGRI